MLYPLSFIAAAFLSWVFTFLVRRGALKFGITDNPDSPRKIHPRPTPLLGGLAAFLAFWLTLGALIFFTDALPARYIAPDFLWGIFVAGLL
ncbi:MAG: undecaprenyl/decaprenyl-phosphate alpha-N-acetylglucosaminyl 1-phosphate transferase, partial [Parcubacteria group bacterium]|nr:undecaprenyl/decaprenyl-phosphate alpha-N-acetylglucosaminyl 1-phosphate transferase [Parcubacteria group bacterium]